MNFTGTCVDGNPIMLKNIVYMTPLSFVIDSLCRMALCGKVGKNNTPLVPSLLRSCWRISWPFLMYPSRLAWDTNPFVECRA
jgi:hypothetical protein